MKFLIIPLVILLTGCTHSFHLPPAAGPIPPTEITVTDSAAISPGPAFLVTDKTQEPVNISATTAISSGHQTLTIQSLTDSPAPQKAADQGWVTCGVNQPCRCLDKDNAWVPCPKAADAAPEAKHDTLGECTDEHPCDLSCPVKINERGEHIPCQGSEPADPRKCIKLDDDACTDLWIRETIRARDYCAANPHGKILLHLPALNGRTLKHIFPCDFKLKAK